MEHFASPGNIDFAADDQRIFMYYSWKAHVFIHLWNNVYNRWITSNFPFRWHRTASTTSGLKSSIFNRNSSGERRLKFIASGEDDDNKKPRAKHREHRLAQRRQRRQHSDHKHVQTERQRQNTTIKLQMEPMKRGNTASKSDGEIRQRLQFTVKLSSSMQRYAATVTRSVQCTSRISFHWTEDSLSAFYTMGNIGFYSKLYFTTNSL